MPDRRTRTGPIREGIEYQDLFGVSVLIEWLQHPKRYEWVKLEADEFGSLDDITACTPGKNLLLIQVKYAINPDSPQDEFSLGEILEKPSSETSRRRSLFQKWFSSWRDARDSGQFASILPQLLTNRHAAASLLQSMYFEKESGRLHIDSRKVASASSEQWKEVLSQSANQAQDVETFFSIFELHFDSPEIAVQRAALKIRAQNLGITDDGYASLERSAKEWASKRDLPSLGGFIRLDDVRFAAQWSVPRGLSQQFEVPPDFVPVRGRLVEGLIKKFREITGGVEVIFGSPGAGKSTFLSDLFEKVRNEGITCIRHHYFLQPKDPDRINRLTYDRACDALLHDILIIVSEGLPNKNPTPSAFGDILHASARSLAAQGKTLVLIVDGLDEVIRESDVYELRRFLTEIFPSGPGLWIVLGTRRLSEQRVASLIRRELDEEKWIEVPRFDDDQCRQLLESNAEQIKIHEQHIDEFTRKFRECTQGHPLHARYMIEALKQISNGGFAHSSDIDRVPPYGSGLSDFYLRLFETLTADAKEVANLLALAAFSLTALQVIEILAMGRGTTSSLLEAMNSLKPYIKTRSQSVELFHSSFQEFIRSTHEYASTKTVLLVQLEGWLKDYAPEPLRWAHLNRIRYFRGNSTPLLETVSREWAVLALADARPLEEIVDQIDWATHASMQAKAFGSAFMFDQLSIYMQNSVQFDDKLWDRIDVMAQRMRYGYCFNPLNVGSEIAGRSPDFLLNACVDLSEIGQLHILDLVFNELNNRTVRRRSQPAGTPGDEWWPSARALVAVAALARIAVPSVVAWAIRFREAGQSVNLLARYAETLADSNQITSMRQLVSSPDLEAFERDMVEDTVSRLALLRRSSALEQILSDQHATIWSKLHSILSGRSSGVFTSELPSTRQLPNTAREYDTAQQHELALVFERIYLAALLLVVQGSSNELEQWRKQLDKSIWAQEASDTLAQVAANNAAEIRNSGRSECDFTPLEELSVVLFPENRDRWGIWHAFHLALKRLLATFISLRFSTTGKLLDRELLAALKRIKQLSRHDLTDIILEVEPSARSPEAMREFIDKETESWDSAIETFPERAEYYLDLAQVLYDIPDYQACRKFVKLAISNAIGYGYHKDLSIYESIEAIRDIHSRGSSQARALLARLVPIAKWSGDFTDGDETKDLLIDAVKVCQTVCPEVLHAIYVALVHEEKLYFAEDVFPLLVEVLDLSDPFQQALARTSIDSESLEKLKRRADGGDPKAAGIFKALEGLGEMSTKPEKSSGSTQSHYENSEQAPDFETIPPDLFPQWINSIEPRYKMWDLCMKWFQHHIKSGDDRAIYFAVKTYLEAEGTYGADGEFLLEIVPYADEFEGPSAGFDLLCNAAVRSHAWSRFFTETKIIDAIWATLEGRYPKRWLEFIYKTRMVSDYGAPLQKLRSLTASVGTRFLGKFGPLEQAENLTEASVRTIEDLMANLKFPNIDWFAATKSPLDSLCARLFWISNAVRERAAAELANLLLDNSTYDLTFSKLVEALAKEQLESRVVVLLLPLLRAARRGQAISIAPLVDAIKSPSLVSYKILEELRLEGQRRGT